MTNNTPHPFLPDPLSNDFTNDNFVTKISDSIESIAISLATGGKMFMDFMTFSDINNLTLFIIVIGNYKGVFRLEVEITSGRGYLNDNSNLSTRYFALGSFILNDTMSLDKHLSMIYSILNDINKEAILQ